MITANAETVVVSPPGLQDAINAETGIFALYFFLFVPMISHHSEVQASCIHTHRLKEGD